jgi:membrane-associated phospholipid phosphatase
MSGRSKISGTRKPAGFDNEVLRVSAGGVAALLIALIGISRIYLGAHYFTDVIGAIAIGLAWLAFSWTEVETLRGWRGRSFKKAV